MIKQILALAGLTLSLSANAVIVDLGNITRDTATGLDWLDVTKTRGRSYNQVTAQMVIGGAYEGYRYATMAELDQLIINFGYTAINTGCAYTALHCDNSISGESEIIELMINTLGDTHDAWLDDRYAMLDVSSPGAGITYGLLGSQNIKKGKYDLARIYDGDFFYRRGRPDIDRNRDGVQTAFGSSSNDGSIGNLGSYLVAPSPVPLPAAGWLFMFALVGLVSRKRLARR